jgi:allose kinase
MLKAGAMRLGNPSYVVGVDIGGTNIRLGLLDKKGILHHFESFRSYDFKDNPQVDKALAELVYQWILHKGIPWEHLVAVVLGLPATLDRQDGFVYSCPNFRNLEGKRIRTTFQNWLPIPIYVEKDTNLAILGEHHQGAARGYQDVLGVFIGTGLGCGIILGGSLHLGAHGVAAELGHIPVPNREEVCGCGNKGCIEIYASGGTLERALQARPDPESDIQKVFLYAAKGDPFWRQTIDHFLEMVAIAISAAVNLLDPQVVVIGGGVLQMEEFPFAELVKRVLTHVRKPEPARSLAVVKSVLGEYAGLVGAAILGFTLRSEERRQSD